MLLWIMLFNLLSLSEKRPNYKNIFADGELNEKVVVAKITTTTQHGAMEGKTRTLNKTPSSVHVFPQRPEGEVN